MTPTSVGMRCPECSKQRTQARTVGPTSDQPTLTYILIAINVAIAIGATASGAGASGGRFGESGLVVDGALSRATVDDGELWRLVTSGFIHDGLAHLLFNMLGLWILGGMLEPALGRLRFGLVYFVSLLGGAFGALLLQPVGFTVGASGAVFGLMGAALIVLRNRGIGLMESGLGFWLGLNLLFSLRPGISLGGHLGGFVAGALVALILVELPDRVRLPRGALYGLSAALGLVAIAGAVVVSA